MEIEIDLSGISELIYSAARRYMVDIHDNIYVSFNFDASIDVGCADLEEFNTMNISIGSLIDEIIEDCDDELVISVKASLENQVQRLNDRLA